MNKIICPVDFSPLSHMALKVAAKLAVDFNVELTVLHVVHFPIANELPDQAILATGILDDLEKEKKKLTQWLHDLAPEHNALKSKVIVKTGFLLEELHALGDRESLIVSGTSGTNDFTNKLLGSITGDIFYKGVSPVLLIPQAYHHQPFLNICFATDLMAAPQWDVHEIIALGRRWGAHIAFLSVMDDVKRIDVEAVENSFVHQYLRDSGYENTSFHLSQASSPVEGIKAFMREQKTDLLVLTHKERSFWRALFEKSTSGAFVAHPEMPVLLFHEGPEK